MVPGIKHYVLWTSLETVDWSGPSPYNYVKIFHIYVKNQEMEKGLLQMLKWNLELGHIHTTLQICFFIFSCNIFNLSKSTYFFLLS